MSKIVAVHASSKDVCESGLDKRQILLTVEDCPRLIVQFDDIISTCQACERELLKSCGGGKASSKELKQQQQQKKDYQSFLNKYAQLISSSAAKSEFKASPASLKKTASASSLSYSTPSSASSASSSPLPSPYPLSSLPGPDHDDSFDQKFVLEAKPSDLTNTISQVVTCIGCKTSVERFYRQLVQQQQQQHKTSDLGPVMAANSRVLDPIVVNSNGSLTLKQSVIDKPASLYSLFYLNNSKLIDVIPKIKKNRRCHLHSLDTQKQRTLNDWFYVWDALGTTECRKKAIAIESRQLSVTLESYLRKHKFCGDCKMKVVRAYQILLGELDPTKEKGFCSSLYSGIECCSGSHSAWSPAAASADSASQTVVPSAPRDKPMPNQHIHINCDKQFIMNLILKAEPEIHGSRRERHAKTIDIAQEEVLTCIGLYIYERFHRIYQAMKAEEQTWQILFYASILSLKKCFELEFERRSGVSRLELLCAELAALDSNNNSANTCSSSNGTSKSKKKQKQSSQIKSAKKKDAKQQKASSVEKLDEKSEDESKDTDDIQTQREDSSSCSNSVGNLLAETEETTEIDQEDEDDFDEELNYPNDEDDSADGKHGHLDSNGQQSTSPFSSSSSSFTSSSSSASSSYANQSTSSPSVACGTEPALTSSSSTCCECSNVTDKASSFNFDFFKTDDFCYSELNDETTNADDDDECLITDEEKKEYYANKSLLMNERLHRREILQQKFQIFKLNASTFQLRPRNVS